MASTYLQGIPRPVDLASAVLDTDFAVARQWAVNRNPFYSRLRTVPVDSYVIDLWPSQFRPRTTTLGAAVADTTGTTITLANASIIMNGDRLQLNSGEVVEVIDHPNTTANTITVRRGAAGTVAATQTNGSTVMNLGNSRTGAETFQKAITQVPGHTSQYVQTFQHVYSVGGGQAVIRPRYLPAGVTPFPNEKQDKMTNLIDDIEIACMYGKAENVGGAVSRYAMAGLFNLIATNSVTAPTNASAYKPSDFYRDAIQPIVSNGGAADVAFVSQGWVSGLAVWGFPGIRYEAGSNVFGMAIDAFSIPLYPNMMFMLCPLMQGISAIVGQSVDFYWGVLEATRSQEYGILGDAREGDWLARQCILVNNEQKQATVRNITGFAPQS